MDEAQKSAKEESFIIVVNDSIHKVGEPGGKIIFSEPPNRVRWSKKNRKIYVDITKFSADEIFIGE